MKEKLTEQELNQVLQFAEGLSVGFGNNYGFYNPFSQNNNLLDINNNPKKPTENSLLDALSSVPYDKELLSQYSQFMEVWDAIYGNTLRYYYGLLAYDLSFVCTNIKNPNEYKSEEYKNDLKRVHKFLDRFAYKTEFSKITTEILRSGVAFTWFRDSESIDDILDIEKRTEKMALQIMPTKHCKITGYTSNSTPLYDFDVSYFLNPNVDINLFSPQLIKKFKNSYKEKPYIPSTNVTSRNGIYAEWVQTSYIDGAYCFKWDVGNARILPPFATLLKSCLNNDLVSKLQKDKNLIGAYLLLAGEIKTVDSAKTDKADQFKISPKTMGQFLNLITSGLSSNIKPLAMPVEDLKGWQFQDSNVNMEKNQYANATAQGASASELIYHTENLSQFAMENAIYTDFSIIEPLYYQYANFLNYYVNKKTSKYKFAFTFNGLNRQWDREKRQTALRNYADKGIVLDSTQWASAIGMKPQDFMRSLECAHNSDFIDTLTLMLNPNTMSQDNGQSGAPRKDGLEKSDKTEEVEDYVN